MILSSTSYIVHKMIVISLCSVLHLGKHNQFAFIYLLLGKISFPTRASSISSEVLLPGFESSDVFTVAGVDVGREK